VPARRRLNARFFAFALAFLVGAVVGVLVLPLGATSGDVGPGRLSLSTRWDRDGDTTLVVPPLGRVIIDTHAAPLGIEARIEEVDLEKAQRLARDTPTERELEEELRVDLAPLIRTLVLRTAVVALVAGALIGALVSRHRWSLVGLAAAGAIVSVTVLGVWTWRAFDVDQFAEPRYEGALERAPDVLAAVEREFGNLEGVTNRVETLSRQLDELFALATDPNVGPLSNDVRILHVSDIHSNPLAVEVVRSLASQFEVDAVLDTGDLTSFGLPVEARLGELIERVRVPYYLVPGNHDSPANRRALGARENVVVLDGEAVSIAGVRVLGVGDPRFTAEDGDAYEELKREREEMAPDVAALARRERPDILAVASLTMAEEAVGDVPLAISGDVHERTEREEDGTVLLTVGSTGATGLGSFTIDTQRPYEAQVLHLRGGELVARDYVTLQGVGGNFTVERVVYGDGDGDGDGDGG
jgi:predicted phosphodiesterase